MGFGENRKCMCMHLLQETYKYNKWGRFLQLFYSFQQLPKYPKYSLFWDVSSNFTLQLLQLFWFLRATFHCNFYQVLRKSANKKDTSTLFKLVLFSFIAWKYFNIELKSTVAQHENLAAKGIIGVRVPLRFFFSFRLNKNNPRDFFTDQ